MEDQSQKELESKNRVRPVQESRLAPSASVDSIIVPSSGTLSGVGTFEPWNREIEFCYVFVFDHHLYVF